MKEGWGNQRARHWAYNNQDEDTCRNGKEDNNDNSSSQKDRSNSPRSWFQACIYNKT